MSGSTLLELPPDVDQADADSQDEAAALRAAAEQQPPIPTPVSSLQGGNSQVPWLPPTTARADYGPAMPMPSAAPQQDDSGSLWDALGSAAQQPAANAASQAFSPSNPMAATPDQMAADPSIAAGQQAMVQAAAAQRAAGPTRDIPNSEIWGASPQGGGRPVGMLPADKAYNAQLGASIDRAQADRDQALGAVGDIARNFSDQTNSLVEDSQVAKMAWDADNKRQTDSERAFRQETAENASKIRAKLADMEAQGINPNRYFQNAGTVSNILSAISVGLGGMAALNAHNGGRNPGLEMLNDAISRDIDAQKTDMQHSLEVVGKENDLDNSSFEHQNALLKAERDSTLTAYQIAQNQISKFADLYKGNADVQTSAQKLIQGTQDSLDDRIDALHQRQWQLQKGAMAGVGGAAQQITPKMIGDATIDLIKSGVPAADARRQAIQSFTGRNLDPDSPEKTIAKTGAAGGIGRGAMVLMHRGAQLDTAEAAATELANLTKSGATGTDAWGRMKSLSQTLDSFGFKGAPTSSGLTDMNAAQAAQILQNVRNEKASIQNRLMQVRKLGGVASDVADTPDPSNGVP
jgi:hypothetical protein